MTGRTISFFSLANRAFWFWFGAIWFVVGLGLLWGGLEAGIRNQRWERERKVARGSVVAKELRAANSDDDQGRAVLYVSYRFATPEGRSVVGESTLGAEEWKQLEQGSPIQIEYLPGDPAVNRVAGRQDGDDLWIMLPLGAFFGLAGGFLFLKGLRRMRTWRRLMREGVPAEGRVTAVEESNVRFNNRPLWLVRYRYQDRSGQIREGKSGYLSGGEAAEWKVGDTGSIHFDSRNPEESVWIGKA